MPDELRHLNKEDLFLLMESYRNMITMHSTLVEQQKQIISIQNNMVKKQEDIFNKQNQSCDQLARITEKLEDYGKNLLKTNDDFQSSYNHIDKSIGDSFDVVKDRLHENRLENTKQHAGINIRIYIAMGAMVSIILTILAIGNSLSGKFELLTHIHEMLRTAVHFITNATP